MENKKIRKKKGVSKKATLRGNKKILADAIHESILAQGEVATKTGIRPYRLSLLKHGFVEMSDEEADMLRKVLRLQKNKLEAFRRSVSRSKSRAKKSVTKGRMKKTDIEQIVRKVLRGLTFRVMLRLR